MDQETAQYIINYFPILLSLEEVMAIRHTSSSIKLGPIENRNVVKEKMYKRQGWLTEDESVLALLDNGYDTFEISVASRIIQDHADKVFLNTCPNCGRLARTPFARQCRHCGHNWHDVVAGRFQLKSSFQLIGRHFYLLGDIVEGEINVGNFVDLTFLGLAIRPKIDAIDFLLKRNEKITVEDIGLGIGELDYSIKRFLIEKHSFGIPIDILKNE